MPARLAHPCARPGCPNLTRVRYCDACGPSARRRYETARGTATQRGYDARWRVLRVMILARDPFCRVPGCHAISTEVDHIVPKARGGSDAPANLQGLCHAHHSQKTVLADGGFGARGRRAT